MNVASKKLSEELYRVSGWDDKDLEHYVIDNLLYPAYDAGYLLRKLPGVKLEQIDKNFWTAQKSYNDGTELPDYKSCEGDTPEDALCKLAIELFKSGVLK